ncbi:MAG: aminotransferase class III-fold pyridoxal phosphate-dependent enzyme, partial [Bacteroidota bacterium]
QAAEPKLDTLCQQLIYNDANDYNLLVQWPLGEERIGGAVDFGDAVHAPIVCDLAIACAYAAMGKNDPMAATMAVVEGFHKVHPLEETEVAILFPLIALRLLVSVTTSAINARQAPENEYLQISSAPAWRLLQQLRTIAPSLAHYHFRHACGWAPCPQAASFRQWMATQNFLPVVETQWQGVAALDLSVGSLDLGHHSQYEEIDAFCDRIDGLLQEQKATIGLGGYGEVRPFYTTDAYQVKGHAGPRWRTVHLGLDIWAAAGTAVRAPFPGRVRYNHNNIGERNYGPTLILEHEWSDGQVFYSLYGHLSEDSLRGLQAGDAVVAGQLIARIGDRPINGNWPPHLHFQLMLDLLNEEGDFPGVAFPEVAEIWKSLCPDPAAMILSEAALASLNRHLAGQHNLALDHILQKRRSKLGKGLSISYQKPLIVPRASRQYLYDQTGRRFLDTVNNVAHVGHQHPKVVQAASRQIAVLNTNTRYLHPQILQYAESLLATLPEELCVVHFVNSGSEANELALRMAKTMTERQDVVAVDVGYHGNTGACIDVSSYKFDGKGGSGAPAHTHIVPMPDTYRGIFRADKPNAGMLYAETVREAIGRMEEQGRRPAAFICEGILSCGGQVVLPAGYLKAAFSHVRQAGGICIVDEVQTGFGRVGEHFWAFELQGVVPDIVTMGKPIGNGHPLGAVVCTREVADAFANGMEFFNTFGGNPVSCAVGSAVLDVVQEEGLQQNALTIGRMLQNGLRQLQGKYHYIGDVRGHGLFLGFELVKNGKTLEPAADWASFIVNQMRERAILMSTDGPLHNVIKIKPPMCFNEQNVHFFLEELELVLQMI